MDLLPLFQWFEATTPGTIVRESIWMFPMIQCFHLLALSLLGGTVLALDMRMLGLGLTATPIAELGRKLHPWMKLGLIVIVVSGVLMFLSEAIKCFYSPPFFYKITLLILATIFTFTFRQRVVESSETATPVRLKLTALISLALWFGVGFSGRWIAFY
jgi:hypothetical protein